MFNSTNLQCFATKKKRNHQGFRFHFLRIDARLDLNLNLYAAGKFELHQGIDGLGSRAVDVNEALVVRELELLACLFVDERTTVHRENTLVGGQGNRATHDGACGLHCLHNLLC